MDILLSLYFNSCNPASRRIARLLSFFITTMNSFWETNHISDSSSYNSFSTRMNVPSSLCVPNSIGSPPPNTLLALKISFATFCILKQEKILAVASPPVLGVYAIKISYFSRFVNPLWYFSVIYIFGFPELLNTINM